MSVEAVKGKFGFYPCDKDLFLKLKFLNKIYFQSLYMKANWERWNRKAPHNRVMRAKIRNSAGQVVGYQPPIPRSEPQIDSIFLEKKQYGPLTVVECTGHVSNNLGQRIYQDYRRARYPVASAADVKPLMMSVKEIEELYLKAQNLKQVA